MKFLFALVYLFFFSLVAGIAVLVISGFGGIANAPIGLVAFLALVILFFIVAAYYFGTGKVSIFDYVPSYFLVLPIGIGLLAVVMYLFGYLPF